MRSITVDVTLDDIAHGHKMDCNFCPVALAVGRHFEGALEIVAGAHRIDVHFRDSPDPADTVKMYRGLTPWAATAFMEKFDGGHPVSPLTFELTLYPHTEHTPPARVVL